MHIHIYKINVIFFKRAFCKHYKFTLEDLSKIKIFHQYHIPKNLDHVKRGMKVNDLCRTYHSSINSIKCNYTKRMLVTWTVHKGQYLSLFIFCITVTHYLNILKFTSPTPFVYFTLYLMCFVKTKPFKTGKRAYFKQMCLITKYANKTPISYKRYNKRECYANRNLKIY